MTDNKNFQYNAFIYEDHLTPTGLLPREKKVEASAAWHFTRLASIVLKKVPAQVTIEGRVDRTVDLKNLARSIQIQYGLAELADFLCFMDFCRAEAFRCAYPWDSRLQAWVESGGKAYNFVTREPEALNKS